MLLLLIRHGSTDDTTKRLVGRTPGVHLSATGQRQAEAVVARLEGVPIDMLCSSPMERARETATPLAESRGLIATIEPALNEVDYGKWTGKEFKTLRRQELWRQVQQEPAAVRFPGGESIREAQARVVDWIEALAEAQPKVTVAAVSHGDVIKAAMAHVAGIHLDLFQRLLVAPGSISGVVVGARGRALLTVNEVGGVAQALPRPRRRTRQN